jgi:hypothetical protein
VLPKVEAEPWPNCLKSVVAAGGSWGDVLEEFATAERRSDAEPVETFGSRKFEIYLALISALYV